ncbi:MAG: hypothetical protein ACU0CO_11910 [Shimia sp.]
MTRLSLAALFASVALPAAAQTICTFTIECVEAHPCTDAAFDLILTGQAFESVNGDVPLVMLDRIGEGLHAYAAGDATFQMLTVGDVAARLSVHYSDGPLTVTYSGTCEATE